MRLKTDTFGHAVFQHSLLQVGAQVVYLLIGLKRNTPCCHSGVVTCCKLSHKYEIKN